MRTLATLISLLFFIFIYGFYIAQSQLQVIPSNLKRDNSVHYYDYRGVTNVHTNLSTGSSEPLEVISEAKKAGLDFLVFTDVNQWDPIDQFSGYHGNLLVLTAGEYTYLDSRLIFYTSKKDSLPSSPQESHLFFTDLLSQKDPQTRESILVLAAPFQNGPAWAGTLPTGLDGVEVLNPKIISQKSWVKSKLNVLWSILWYPFNSRFSFLRLFNEPHEETLLWDELSLKGKVFGFSGTDVTARSFPFSEYLIKFPSYQKSFELVSNHILLDSELTGSVQKDQQKILSATKKGQFYFSMDLLGDPKGFWAAVQDKDTYHPMGARVKWNKNQRIVAELPIEPRDFYEILVFKNGERVNISNQPRINYEPTGPGQYRISVRVSTSLPIPDGKRWMTWIYTNPFILY